ncbi:MAG: patatin-like phospholipase family protein [Pseudomonadota bacterium]
MGISGELGGSIVSWLAFLFIFGLFVVLQGRFYAAQYAYFLRVPLVFAALAWMLPVLAFSDAGSAVLENWFDLQQWDFFFVALLATLYAWALMFQFGMIWESAPLRMEIPFKKSASQSTDTESVQAENALWSWLQDGKERQLWFLRVPPQRLFIFFLLFAAPTLGATVLKSSPGWQEGVCLCLGVLCAYGFWWVSRAMWFREAIDFGTQARNWCLSRMWGVALLLGVPTETVQQAFADAWNLFLERIGWSAVIKGLDASSQAPLTFSVVSSRSYFMAALCLYAYVGFAFYPEHGNELRVPPLFYLLTMLLVISYVTSFLSLWFDIYRIPALSLVLFLTIAIPSDHFFSAPKQRELPVKEAANPGTRNGIIVAASGGGITASYWTGTVLAELHRLYPNSFSVDFLSAVSGGSVGAVFYSAALSAGIDDERVLHDFQSISGESSLAEVGWGLSYPDLWRRVLNLPFTYDRAHAVEARWRELMNQRFGPMNRTLKQSSASEDATVIAINAVVAETGQRMVFTNFPLYADSGKGRSLLQPDTMTPDQRCSAVLNQTQRALLFSEVYPERDIALETAARLSATFPYVTPVARIEPEDIAGLYPADCAVAKFHFADGGYLDNWGIATALDYLAAVQESATSESADARPHLLIEIRANGPIENPAKVSPGATAPFKTMLNVRSSSQIERNERLLDLTQQLQPEALERVVIELGIDAPLSWHLSNADRERINCALRSDSNQHQLRKVGRFLGELTDADLPQVTHECDD